MAAMLTEARGGREVFFTAAESTFNQLADEAEGTAAFAVYAVSQLGVAKQVGCVLAATPPRRSWTLTFKPERTLCQLLKSLSG